MWLLGSKATNHETKNRLLQTTMINIFLDMLQDLYKQLGPTDGTTPEDTPNGKKFVLAVYHTLSMPSSFLK